MLRALIRATLAASLLAIASPIGCTKDEPAVEKAPPPAVLSPVPAPAGLLADVYVPSPEATWTKARIVAFGGSMFLPRGFGGLATMLLGLPITAAAEVDGNVPALGAIVQTPSSPRPGSVIGLHVQGGGRLVEQLTLGEAPHFTSRVDAATGITMLTPVSAKSDVTLGVLGNYLLVANSAESLTLAGPYVARTLPTKAEVSTDDLVIDLPHAALSGSLATTLKGAWEAFGGGPEAASDLPSSREVAQALIDVDGAMGTWLSVLAELDHARLTLRFESDAMRARVAMTPKAGSAVITEALSGLAFGDAKPLLSLPKDTLAGAMWRDRPEARSQSAASQAKSVAALLGDKGSAGVDVEALTATFQGLGEARGEWTLLGITLGPTGPAGYARAPVVDRDKVEKALSALGLFVTGPLVKARLAEAKVGLTKTKTVLEGMPGDVARYHVVQKDAKAPKEPAKKGASGELETPGSLDLLVSLRDDALVLATGYESRDALRRAILAPSGDSLGTVEEVKAAVEALGSDVAFALVVEPLSILASRSGKPGTAPSAPLAIALGKDPSRPDAPILLRIDIANPAVLQLAKGIGGF